MSIGGASRDRFEFENTFPRTAGLGKRSRQICGQRSVGRDPGEDGQMQVKVNMARLFADERRSEAYRTIWGRRMWDGG